MRRFTIFAVILIIGFGYLLMNRQEDFTPFSEVLAHHINATTFYVCQDPNFGTEIKVPGGFVQEADSIDTAYSYKRFAYYPPATYIDADGQILIEYSADVSTEGDRWTEKIDSISRSDDYLVFAKSIRIQKMQFSYQVTYPIEYDESLSRLKQEIRGWKAIGSPRPKILPVVRPRRQRPRIYHSGFGSESAYIESPFLMKR